jgi:hypothetical protein
LSAYNLFNPALRASDLPDALLLRLLPDASAVTIIRHEGQIDLDQVDVRKSKARLYPSDAACYADFVMFENTAIWPNPDVAYQQLGPVGSLIVGGNRAVARYWLQVHRPDAERPEVFTKRLDGPLASPPADIRGNPQRMRDSLNAAFATAMEDFVRFVEERHNR